MTEPREILAILHQDRVQFKAMLKTLPETEIDAAFEEADREEKLEFLRLLPIKQAASTFSDLPLSEQVDFLPDLPSDRLRLMGAFLGPDEVADLIGEVSDPEDRQYLLSSLPPVLVRSALELTQYPEDDAGGIMTPEFVALRRGITAGQAIAFLRLGINQAETVSTLYLVDQDGRLLGVVPLEALVTAPVDRIVDTLAKREIISAKTDTHQEDVAKLMRDYDLSVLPITDDDGILKGIVTIDDVIDVLQEEATEDIYKGAAMEGSEIDYRSASPFLLWRKRIVWLILLFFTESLTSYVISGAEGLLKHFIVLVMYQPLIIGTGGNTGSQSATLVIRALTTGQLRGRDALRILWKEMKVGLLIGITIGIFMFFRIFLFRQNQGAGVAISVAISIFAVSFLANLVGTILPFAFKKLGVDPALTSSPFLATLMDATGLLVYFSIARLILNF